MKTDTKTLENNAQSLKDKAHLNTDAAATMAHDFIDRTADRLSRSEEKLRDTAAATGKTLASSLDSARTRLAQTNLATQSYVQRHPLRTIGFALTAGAALAMLLRRKPNRAE